MISRTGFTAAIAVFAGLAMLAATQSADAGWRNKRAYEVERGHTVAHSRHGNGSIGARVRGTRKGPQVQLPNGRWTYCRTSCSETLRVKTIDYDANPTSLVGRGTLQAECGIFGCLDIGINLDR